MRGQASGLKTATAIGAVTLTPPHSRHGHATRQNTQSEQGLARGLTSAPEQTAQRKERRPALRQSSLFAILDLPGAVASAGARKPRREAGAAIASGRPAPGAPHASQSRAGARQSGPGRLWSRGGAGRWSGRGFLLPWGLGNRQNDRGRAQAPRAEGMVGQRLGNYLTPRGDRPRRYGCGLPRPCHEQLGGVPP